MTGLLKRWTDEEWAQAQELLKTHTPAQAAQILGRAAGSVRCKINWERRTPADREIRNQKMRELARAQRKTPRLHADLISTTGPKIDPALVAERDARGNIPPRDLTAVFCGDPKPGYSALERRS